MYFVKKYNIELGSFNGIVFAIGITEFVSHSYMNSTVIFIAGFLLFYAFRLLLTSEEKVDNIPA